MKNILLVFRHDLRLATSSVISLIVLFGVVVIPSFFGWFNVLASWDPFDNVKNMTVAVASSDDGYQSDLVPIKINIGEQVISTLRANSDLNWVFTTPDEAIEGTKSEKYYAALVLPPDFSRDMMTFLSPGATKVQIAYYSNEKKNGIAPEITQQAATEVSTQINQAFANTLNEVGLSVVSSLAQHLDDPSTNAAFVRLEARVDQLAGQLHASSDTAEMFTALISSSKPLVNSATSFLDSSVNALQVTTDAIGSGLNAASALGSTLDSATAQLGSALSSSADSYQRLADRVNELYASYGAQTESITATLGTLAAEVNTRVGNYQTFRDELLAQAAATDDQALKDALNLVASRMDDAIAKQEALRDQIQGAADKLAAGNADGQAAQAEVTALVDQAESAIESVQSAYANDLKPQLDQLAATMSSINSGFLGMSNDVSAAASTLSGGSGSLLDALTDAQNTSAAVAGALHASATRFDNLAEALTKAAATGDLSEVTKIIGSNPALLAGELASPVGLDRKAVFKVDTFGEQMTPLYSVLALWVGALLLSVLISVNVVRETLPVSKPLTLTQEYLGRYGFFAVLAFLQSSLLYIGLIGFVGVRPVYPFLLILAGWVMSLVFSIITYTLVVAFGEAGKAIAVVLLVIQISAGGGAYPLSVLPEWFQKISPFLPVTHATDAVRSAIAGIYQNDYWISIGWLALFIVPALLLGLVLRRPLVGFNKSLDRALESTKIM